MHTRLQRTERCHTVAHLVLKPLFYTHLLVPPKRLYCHVPGETGSVHNLSATTSYCKSLFTKYNKFVMEFLQKRDQQTVFFEK